MGTCKRKGETIGRPIFLETTLEHGSQEKSDKSPTMPQLENMQLMESRIQVKFLGHILKRWLDSQTALQKNPSFVHGDLGIPSLQHPDSSWYTPQKTVARIPRFHS